MKSATQMKLNPSPNPTKSDFITQVISSIEDGFIPSDRTDLVEKIRPSQKTWSYFFLSFVSKKELGKNLIFFICYCGNSKVSCFLYQKNKHHNTLTLNNQGHRKYINNPLLILQKNRNHILKQLRF